MSKFTYDRLFGDNIHPNIRKKLHGRQNLNFSSDGYVVGESIESEDNFSNYNGGAELSSSTPWARMWCAIEKYSLNPSIEELKDKIKTDGPKKYAESFKKDISDVQRNILTEEVFVI